MFGHVFGFARDRRSKREHSFRPQLEVLETRSMLNGTPVPTPVPAPTPSQAPAVQSNPTLADLFNLAKMGFDATKTVTDSTILANEAILATGRIPPAKLLAAGAAAESVNLALLAPTLASDLWTYGQDLANGKYLNAANDLAALFGDVRGGLLPTAASVKNDVNSVSEDWSKLFPSVTQPAIPAPAPNPAPTPTPPPAPTPTPIPKGPAAAIAGTYSGTLKPSDANDLPFPKDPKTTSRQIKLTINTDGSGSLSVAPFEDQTVFTLPFAAKVTQEPDGTIVLGADVQQGKGSFEFDLIGAEVANGNQLVARNLALTDDNKGLEVSFDNISLNRN